MSIWVFAIPVVGAVIGYVTNWVAIRMLFRPHREKRIGGVRVPFTPGLIPKRRAELAGSIGRSVSRYLLTQEAVSARLRTPAFQGQLEELVERFSQRWLQRELPSVNALVPETFRPEWGGWLEGFKSRLDRWLAALLDRPELHALVQRQTEAQLQRWLDTPLQQLVPDALLDEAPEKLAGVLQRLIESDGLKERIEQFFAERLTRLTEEDQCLADLLPERLQAVFYEKLDDAVPLILERLVRVLEDDRVRKQLKIQLFEMLDSMFQKQFREDSVWDQFKFGLMESFVITPEEIKARIEDAVDEAAPRLAELAARPDVRQRVHQALIDAIERFLNRKFSEFNVEAQTLDELRGRLGDWVVKLVRSDALVRQLTELARDQIACHRHKSLRQLLPGLTQEGVARTAGRLGTALVDWLGGQRVRAQLVAFADAQLDALLERPVGRLDRFVPAPSLARAQAVVVDQAIELLVRETPEIIRRLDIEALVAQQVGTFSLPEVERLIVDVAGRQLKAITWFGALLGFALGLAQMALMLLQP